MGIKVANNAFGTLAASINSSATSITLTTGQGARFPSLGAGDYFYATLIDTSNNLEIVQVTARATDILTIVRAQEGTTARAYSTGDRIEIRLTAQTFLDAVNGQDGDKGDITVSGTGSIWTIDNNAITSAKILDGAITKAKIGYAGAVLQAGAVPYAFAARNFSVTVDRTSWATAYTLSVTPSKSNTRFIFIANWQAYLQSAANYAVSFRVVANGSTVLNTGGNVSGENSHDPYTSGVEAAAFMSRGAGVRTHDPGTTSTQSYAFQFAKDDSTRANFELNHNSDANSSLVWMEIQL